MGAVKKLVDLDAHFIGAGGPGTFDADGSQSAVRTGVGVVMNCPCGCDRDLYVPFANPLDGKPQRGPQGWQRAGDTIDTLTLSPSVLRKGPGSCGWHGWIRNGEAVGC